MYEKHEGRWVETLQSHSHHSDPAAILEAIEEQAERTYKRLNIVDTVALPLQSFRRAYVKQVYAFM